MTSTATINHEPVLRTWTVTCAGVEFCAAVRVVAHACTVPPRELTFRLDQPPGVPLDEWARAAMNRYLGDAGCEVLTVELLAPIDWHA